MRKNRSLALLLTGALALSATGCASLQQGAFENNAVTYQGEEEIPLSYSWWGNDNRHQYTLAGLDLFSDQHPEFSLSPTYGIWEGYERRYRVFMKSHSNTDVMQINYSWLETYSEDGAGYYDLSQLSDVIDLSQFGQEDLEIGSRGGHLNALPFAYNSTVFFYNADLFAQYGLDLPKTWDDLFEAARVMRKDGVYPLGMVKKHLFLMLCARYEQMTGKKLFDTDNTLTATKDELSEMIEFYGRLLEEQVIPSVDEFNNADFATKKLAGVCCWISDVNRYCQSLSDEGVQVVQGDFPAFEAGDTTGWYIKPATMLAISADTLHPEEAGMLLQFLIGDPEMAKLAGTEKGVPVNALAFETLKENDQLSGLETSATDRLNEVKKDMDVILPIMEDSDIIDGFKSESDKYLYGEEDLSSCTEAMLALLS